MKVLIAGSDGMLGSSAYSILRASAEADDTEVWRSTRRHVGGDGNVDQASRVVRIEAQSDQDELTVVLARIRPDVVFNCIAIRADADVDPELMRDVNGEFPHRLALAAEKVGARVVHVSTDAVFSGRSGAPFDELATPDPVDPYGVAKLRGELLKPPNLTIRTSIIGLSPLHAGLLDWAIARRGSQVDGFANVLWNGVTVPELVRLLEPVLAHDTSTSGVVHVFGEAVTKADLLRRVSEVFDLDLQIREVEDPKIDRRLTSVRTDVLVRVRSLDLQLRELAVISGRR